MLIEGGDEREDVPIHIHLRFLEDGDWLLQNSKHALALILEDPLPACTWFNMLLPSSAIYQAEVRTQHQ